MIALTLFFAGILAGTANFFYVYLNLPVIKKDGEGFTEVLSDEERWGMPPLTYKLAFAGYCVIGITGAYLTPLLCLILDLKGRPIGTAPWDQWYLLGYGIIFGYSTNRLLGSLVGSLLAKINPRKQPNPSPDTLVTELKSLSVNKEISDDKIFTLPQSFDDLINLPGSSADYIRGIDISHHNVINDWKAIKNAGVAFAYIKISEGVGTPDSDAQTNALMAKKHGIDVGYYHFGRPDTRNGGTVELDAKAEAKEVKNILSNLEKATLPLMLDLENTETWDSPLQPDQYLKWVEIFLAEFHNPIDLTNAPLIYSRKEYLDRKLPVTHTLGTKYKLWLSRYDKDYKKAISVKGWGDWSIWQFTEAGKLGTNSNLDLNIRKQA